MFEHTQYLFIILTSRVTYIHKFINIQPYHYIYIHTQRFTVISY